MADRAVVTDDTGREWTGWLVEPDDETPADRAAFVPDHPPDGDPDTVWYVPRERLRLAPEPPS
jgi:hypothetical protein